MQSFQDLIKEPKTKTRTSDLKIKTVTPGAIMIKSKDTASRPTDEDHKFAFSTFRRNNRLQIKVK